MHVVMAGLDPAIDGPMLPLSGRGRVDHRVKPGDPPSERLKADAAR
jgi:hypothetical protein